MSIGLIGFARAMREMDRAIQHGKQARGLARPPPRKSRPKNFTAFRDPKGRFVLSYPNEWDFDAVSGICAISRRYGSFARVDVLVRPGRVWEAVTKALAKVGGELSIRREWKGPPRRVRGDLHMAGHFYTWSASAYRCRGEVIVFSTGNVVHSSRSRTVERWEDGTLAAIRRYFKVTAASP